MKRWQRLLIIMGYGVFSFTLGLIGGRLTAPSISVTAHDVFTGPVKVFRVVDGDTIQVEGGEKIRYLGVNTPESTTKKECFGKEAAAKNREMVEGKTVRLEKGRRDRDKYGRLLRFVYVDGGFGNKIGRAS